MIRTLTIAAAAVAALAVPTASRADRRYYGETYTAVTAPQGALDLELWSTYHGPAKEAPSGSPYTFRHQVELETGITDRWDIAAYGIGRQIEGQALEFEAVKAETRFALARPGEWFVDPVLYFEAVKTVVDDKPWSIEEKLILGKDVGRLNLALNVAAEQEFVGGSTNPEWSYAFGSSWEVVPALRVGAELFGSILKEDVAPGVKETERLLFAGPAISLAYSKMWLVLAAGFGLTDSSDAFRARAIFAYQF